MGIFSVIGKLAALPVRVVALPLDAIEKVVDYTSGTDTPRKDRITTGPIHAIGDAIEEVFEDKD